MKASMSLMSVVDDGSRFQSWMVLGKNDCLYMVTLVYGTNILWEPLVLLSLALTMCAASGMWTKLWFTLKSMVFGFFGDLGVAPSRVC